MKKYIPYFLLVIFLFTHCTSSKKYLQTGRYDQAIRKSVKKLRKKPTKEKEILVLEEAYKKANNIDSERIDFLKLEGSPDMWDEVYNRYNKMKNRQNLAKSVIPLEIMSTGRIIQFKMINYDEEIINAKKKAAEYFYVHGKKLLEKDGRENAKLAYFEFKRCKNLYSNYKDVDELLVESKFLATLKVIAEPIPMHSRTFKLSNEFFDNKINEFLGSIPSSEFVRFYTKAEANAINLDNPDHILKIRFDDFIVGQTYVKEKEIHLSKDNVLMGIRVGKHLKTGEDKVTICHISGSKSEVKTTKTITVNAWPGHSKHGDYLGACKTSTPGGGTSNVIQPEVITGTVKAVLFLTTKTISSKGLLDFKIIDANTDRVLTQEKFPGTFAWTCEWGYYNGDGRALSTAQRQSVGGKELPPPPPQTLFIEFTKPIYDQLTLKVKAFYKNY
ncbi:MAG: hypothetical protein COB85_07840 [Bacteroidetes bacterium]|nr:MAG: hypothetical protein COB85_07840 [Bacteroidota bacterium]